MNGDLQSLWQRLVGQMLQFGFLGRTRQHFILTLSSEHDRLFEFYGNADISVFPVR